MTPKVIKIATKDFRVKKLIVTEKIAKVLIAKKAYPKAVKNRQNKSVSGIICKPLKATIKSPLPNKSNAIPNEKIVKIKTNANT